MPAPQIPNLLTLRGRGGRLGRVRGRGGRGGGGSGTEAMQDEAPEEAQRRKDEIVRRTDDDANGSRLSAVAAGLLDDPFAGYFGDMVNAPRRMPIINRGTYVRTKAIDRLIEDFLGSCKRSNSLAQIISLGAGSDTRVFNIFRRGGSDIRYHEIDLPANVDAKIAIVNKHPNLRALVTGREGGRLEEGTLTGSEGSHIRYQILAIDLRELGTSVPLDSREQPVTIDGILPDAPTLIISECCLCYLRPDAIEKVLVRFLAPDKGFLDPSCPVGLAIYEPINPHDSFGLTMVRNLQQRGIEMPTLTVFPTLESQRARFKEYGLDTGARSADIERILQLWFTLDERENIDRKNPLDELEEWQMLAQHYCISWGWRGSPDFWSNWSSRPQ